MMQPRADPVGLFDAHYRAFLETLTHVRADLHRYCTRMTGSVFDGEDVMQETLFEAYRKIEALDVRCALDADAKTFVPAVNSRLRERFGVFHSTIQVDYADCLDEHHK